MQEKYASEKRTDLQIIEHKSRGLELLLFYRAHLREFADAGFRYEGIFEYVQHKPGRPTNFTLRRVKSD
jgi:putative restriction endonuclease